VSALPVIDAAVLGPMRHSPLRSVLAIVAIALGVALGLAIQLINRSAADEMTLAARSLYGLADLAVESSGAGFDESLYPQLAHVDGVAVASPVVEVEAKLSGRRGSLTLIGVDAFRSRLLQPAFAAMAGSFAGSFNGADRAALDPDNVFLSARAARDLGLSEGDTLWVQVGLERQALRVAGVLPGPALQDRAGLIDIATAQWKFGRIGKLTRINLRLAPGAAIPRVRERIEALLPETARLVTPGQATDEALRLSRAYRSNLTALALVALFTGGFFVYSTQALAALRRRREFAIMHAIGVTRRQQLALLLSGSALVGLCGALLGIVLGIAMATLGLRLLGADLGAGYFRGLDANLELHAAELATFLALGVLVAVAGALRPALDSARVPAASALKAGDVASADQRIHPWLIAACMLVAALALAIPPIGGLPLQGYVSIALLLIGAVMAMPAIVRAVLRRAPRLANVSYQVAMAQIAGTARYATLSVSSIIVSFSLMVSMAIMVTSFRTSLDHWTERLLPADIYVRAGYVGQSSHIDPQALRAIEALPGVERAASNRFAQVRVSPGQPPATLIARTLEQGHIGREVWLVARSREPPPAGTVPIWISEAAADLFAWRVGRSVRFDLDGHTVDASVQGVWRDYEHQNGAIVMDRRTYVELTGDSDVNTVWLWLREGVTVDAMQKAIRNVLPEDAEYDLRTPRELRQLSLAAFDRTFAVTYLLEIVAVLIGLFGIAAGVSAQVLARRGEFGALRHFGFTRAQVATMLAIEGGMLGTMGVIVGLVTGAIISLILVYVVNRQSFHWSMDLVIPVVPLAVLSAVLVLAAALIATLAGRHAMSSDVVRAVKEDW
jgi:putative ABC transport system permease protein